MSVATYGSFSIKLKDLITGGMDHNQDVETNRNIILANLISSTGIFCMCLLGIVAVVQDNEVLAIFDFITALVLIFNLIFLRVTRNYQLSRIIGMTVVGMLFFYLLITGGVNNTAHVWYYTFPLFSSFLLGSKKGAIATLFLLILAIGFFVLDLDSPYLTQYSNDFIYRFVPSFFVVLLFSYGFEYIREQKQQELSSANDELSHIVEELKKSEMSLRKTQEELEKRVHDRTVELSKVNQGLNREIKNRELAEFDRREMAKQLAHSQKMEAIGTLAGGVAHDLNNILSASVSYPDLILMDLSEESRLRKPLLTIKKSGLKAAAIVQDLLTLARRGVVNPEVVNLNDAVYCYLDSPEFQNLKELHPHAVFEHNLEANLLNNMGSPVQLSKIIMNLLSNAVEALTGHGNILITTKSEYFDESKKGHDVLTEGDYSVLRISDSGKGIPKEDMKRIFEPFFTNKKMGRSGTGLGMAVVWGTVKDHNGYIEVQSTVGVGTAFTIYFPATRKKKSEPRPRLLMAKYTGRGEKILVVDDVEMQRNIACGMLTKLGYKATAASSGEEAIAVLKENPVDLLLLDMIMDPGIDGLETYKRVLKMYPNQKALIASGFSATARVKELQRLGAGSYIKKPYTLEKIGVHVKKELARNRTSELSQCHPISAPI